MKLYEVAIKNKVFDRVKALLEEDPSFDCPSRFIRYEIFKVLDNETILGLSEDAILEICDIKLIELDDVYVFPVKKISKIVFKDKIKRKIEGIHRK